MIEFGHNHDLLSFRKTIAIWTNDIILNLGAINIMFCAIGFLKYFGILKVRGEYVYIT